MTTTPDDVSSAVAEVLRRIESDGLLLLQDKRHASVVTIITGRHLSTSWWSDPKANLIFATLQALDVENDVLSAKLVGGKVTFVHRRLWPALMGVGAGRAPWQIAGLSSPAKELLRRAHHEGEVEASGPPAKELELRLLVYSREVHTESGRHELRISSWAAAGECLGCTEWLEPGEGRLRLERTAMACGLDPGQFPWKR